MADDRALRDALEKAQGEVRALRAALSQAQDASPLAPLERERDALQAKVRKVRGELADLEAQRERRLQALAGEAVQLTQLHAQREGLVEALIKSLDPGLEEKG